MVDTDRDNTNDIRTDRDPSRLLSMSESYHQFDNPIYATKVTQNTYSIITDAATNDGSTDRQSTPDSMYPPPPMHYIVGYPSCTPSSLHFNLIGYPVPYQ